MSNITIEVTENELLKITTAINLLGVTNEMQISLLNLTEDQLASYREEDDNLFDLFQRLESLLPEELRSQDLEKDELWADLEGDEPPF